MSRLLLWLLMRPKFLWRSMGADPDHLQAILKVKILTEGRRPLNLGGTKSRKSGKGFRAVIQFMISLFMGLLYMVPFLMVENLPLALSFFYTLFAAVLSFVLITDFSTVLFDLRDRYILFIRPIRDGTLFIARALHIFIYIFQLVLPMAIPSWVLIAFLHGPKYALYFPLPLFLLVFLVLFIVLGIYLLLIKLGGPRRFRDLISYFQIAWTMLIIIMGYFLPLFMDQKVFMNPEPQQFEWLVYLPFYWLAMTWVPLGVPAFLPGTAWLGLLSLISFVGLGILGIRVMGRRFIAAMSQMEVQAAPSSQTPKAKVFTSSTQRFEWINRWLNRRPESRAGFQLAWIQTGRSRSFKMKVYPMFGYVPVLFLYIIYSSNRENFSEALSNLSLGRAYLSLLYISGLTVMSAVNYLIYSDHYKAAWVYQLSPSPNPGYILAGAFKALWIKFFLPYFLLITGVLVWIWGPLILFDAILAITNLLVFNLLILLYANRALPFSIMEQIQQSGERVFKSLATLLIPGFLGLVHFLSFDLIWLKILFTALSGILLWMLWDSLIHLKWTALIPKPSKK